MTSNGPETELSPEYRMLYRELQTRMSLGGQLGPGDQDTFAQHRQGVLWTPERERMHATIIEEFQQRCAGLPRDGHAAMFTAGAPGAGKGGALAGLTEWQGQDNELGRLLAEVHGTDIRDYVVLDPDQLKVAIFEHGGAPQLPAGAQELPGGYRVSPAETATLTHRESAHLLSVVEQWARSEGYNLLYDTALRDVERSGRLLDDLRQDGYTQRVVLSVEVPVEQCLAQNANRWQQGRTEFDAGRDWYGGRMAPEGLIKGIYAESGSERGFSIGRENAEKLAERGLATGIITSERGDFGVRTESAKTAPGRNSQAGPAQTSPAFRQGDAVIRTAAASRLRSGSSTATVPGAAVGGTAPASPPRVQSAPQMPGGGGPTR